MSLRRSISILVILASVSAMTPTAHAFEFTFVRQPNPGEPTTSDPAGICVCIDPPLPGDTVTYDLYLDTQGESDIVLFSMGVVFDPNIVTYRSDLSDAEHYYPLYAPGVGKVPATWLTPYTDPPGVWPIPPAGLEQINIEFVAANLNATTATATNLWLGRIVFEAVGPGYTSLAAGWDFGGNVFSTGDGDWIVGPPIVFVWAPEPSTALLVVLGLAGLGMARRRR